MKNRTRVFLACITALAGVALLPSPAYAYMGPGVGLSAVGALLSLIAAGAVSLLGFIWFPIKRAIRMIRSRRKHSHRPSILHEARR
jgi:asparagine N-glycosylation enzyme membrane subunit Stt3